MIKSFSDEAWTDYMYWHDSNDKRSIKRINQLIHDIENGDPYAGLGKPEPLRFELSGKWSRRINEEDRLVYDINEDEIRIYSCRSHY